MLLGCHCNCVLPKVTIIFRLSWFLRGIIVIFVKTIQLLYFYFPLMKKIIFLILLSICYACSNDNYQSSEDDQPKYINIKLNVIPENIDMTYEPLRSEDTDNIYAINIYQLNPNTNKYDYYCCGVFDNANNISISFQKGYKYKIHAAMFVDYFDQYNFTIDNNEQQTTQRLTNATNSFQYNASYIYDLDYNFYLLANEDYTRAIRPNIDSYHSVKEGYEPTENSRLEMTLKRSAFGFSVNVEGLKEGEISGYLRTQKYYNYVQPEFSIIYPNKLYDEIYTMLNPLKEFDTMDVVINYTSSNGEVTELIREENFTFNKNVRTIFNIKINTAPDSNFNTNISLNIDTSDFTESTSNYNCTI